MNRGRSLALAALLALALAGCAARTGGGWSLAESEEKDKTSSPSSQSSGDEDEPEEAADVDASDFSEEDVDPEAVAQALLDEGLVTVAAYYDGNFDDTKDINTARMLWAVFKLYCADNGVPEEHDYEGYDQLDVKKADKLVRRWFGPDVPDFEGKPQILGDASTGELVNVDEDKGIYYFWNLDSPIDEELMELKSARADGSVLTIRFNTQTEDKEYAHTYNIKVRPGEDGEYYIAGFNRGQQGGELKPAAGGGGEEESTEAGDGPEDPESKAA